eukprot:scaffold19868_cov10-Tisochrysis_lutea.AAC.1
MEEKERLCMQTPAKYTQKREGEGKHFCAYLQSFLLMPPSMSTLAMCRMHLPLLTLACFVPHLLLC